MPLSRAAADVGVPIRTARRWRAAYEADGATGLARSPGPIVEATRCVGGWPTHVITNGRVAILDGQYTDPAPSIPRLVANPIFEPQAAPVAAHEPRRRPLLNLPDRQLITAQSPDSP